MEKTLKELDTTWAGMEFESERHRRTGVMLLKSSEELIETLEDNQVGCPSACCDHTVITVDCDAVIML